MIFRCRNSSRKKPFSIRQNETPDHSFLLRTEIQNVREGMNIHVQFLGVLLQDTNNVLQIHKLLQSRSTLLSLNNVKIKIKVRLLVVLHWERKMTESSQIECVRGGDSPPQKVEIFIRSSDFSIDHILNKAGNTNNVMMQQTIGRNFPNFNSKNLNAVFLRSETTNFTPILDWLHYTRYHPPRLPRKSTTLAIN